jgi:hypothetical protein
MAAVIPDLSVTITQRRWACVLDPTLTLSRFGLLLVKRLGEMMELWVVRELWHILDNTQFYLQQPDSLLADRTPSAKVQEILCALQEWERVRMETDLAGQRCYWIGDGPVESFLPNDQGPEIVWRYERISCALDRRLGSSTETLAAAFRDAAALTATLDSALILTQLPEDPAENLPPAICRALESWGIPCRAVAHEEPLCALECDYLRQLLVHTGLAKLCWAGLRLAVLQLVVPAAAALSRPGSLEEIPFSDDESFMDVAQRDEPDFDLWQGARGFWYPI